MPDIARHAASDELDVIVTSYGTSYYAGVARKGFMAMRGHESMPYPTEAQARAEANRYWSQIRAGQPFARTVSLYRHDGLSTMHERQAEVLREIPRKHRRVVLNRAHLTQNISGGILSGNLFYAAQEYRRVGAVELENMSRRDNYAAMGACARKGCAGCAKSVS